MKTNFFTYNNQQYFIFFEDKTLKILKKENSDLVKLTENEEKEIVNILSNKKGYEYDSNKLIEIINSNQELESKEYLTTILEWLENIIPANSRENFYNNLKTLKVNLDFDDVASKVNNEKAGGAYNTRDNSIIMDKKTTLKTWEIAKLTSNPKESFGKIYSETLLHELAHMSSSKYDSKTGISLCGFDKFPSDIESEKNRGLTEGFTEIIAMAGFPNVYEFSSNYYIEENLINQLIQIIGLDVFLKSYFENLGTSLLEQKLEKIIANSTLAFQLFRSIEINFQIRDLKEKQNILGNIQLILLDYLEKKCEILSEKGDLEAIKNILQIYKQMLITPKKLQLMNKNPDNYEGIVESIEKFQRISEQFSNIEEIKQSFN